MEYNLSTQQLSQILEEQRKLKTIEELIKEKIEEVNQTINYLTIEEFQLQTCEIEQKTDIDLTVKEEKPTISAIIVKTQPVDEIIQPEQINQQAIDLEINEFQSGAYEMDEDDEEEFY